MSRILTLILPTLCVALSSCDEQWHHVFDMENDGIDNIHIFLPEFEEKGGSNRISPEPARQVARGAGVSTSTAPTLRDDPASSHRCLARSRYASGLPG